MTAPRTRRWLPAALYPFTALAVAINLFLGALIVRAAGGGSLDPMTALWGGLLLGVPANVAATAWVRRLLAEAERDG